MAPPDPIDPPEVRRGPGRPPKTPVENVAPEQQAALNLQDDIARIEEIRASLRKEREGSPFGDLDLKLAFRPIQGYKQHWFNDRPGRLEAAKGAGWTTVEDSEGKPRQITVDRGGLRAYLMKIPEQFWEEDQARQTAKADRALNAVKAKPTGAAKDQTPNSSDRDKFYLPEGKDSALTIVRPRL